MSHRPAITLHVEWTPDAPTDVTDQFVDLDVYHGGSTTAVERPSVAPGDGWATLEITDIEHRTDRYGVTLAADGTSIWSGWISAPELTDQRRRSRWRLTGGSAENLAEIAAFNSAGGSVVGALDAVSPTALVKRGLTDRRHRTVSVERPLGELLSQLAGALAAEIVECAGGQLAVCAVRPAGTVPTQALTGADTWVVPTVVSRDDSDRLRNTVRVQLTEPVAPTGVSGHVIKERYVLAGDPGYADRSGSPIVVRFDLVIPGDAATDEAFVNPTVSFRSQRIVAVSDGRYSRLSSARAAGRGSSLPGGGLSAGVLRAEVGARVGVTVPVIVTVPADQPPSLLPAGAPATATSASRTGSWWLTDAAIAARDSAAPVYYALQLYIRIQLAWGATAGSTFDTVADDASVARWGIRELRRPDWLIETNADAVALLAALSEPRREHELTLPLQQPTPARSAAVAAIDTGDYLAVALSDAARAVSISAICLVTGRRVAVNDVGEAHVTLTCLETGAVVPRSIGAGTPVRGEGALTDATGTATAATITVTGTGTPVRGEGALTDATGTAGGAPGPVSYEWLNHATGSMGATPAWQSLFPGATGNLGIQSAGNVTGRGWRDPTAPDLAVLTAVSSSRLQFSTSQNWTPTETVLRALAAQAVAQGYQFAEAEADTAPLDFPAVPADAVFRYVASRSRRGRRLTWTPPGTVWQAVNDKVNNRGDLWLRRTPQSITVTGTGTPVAADGVLTDATGTAAPVLVFPPPTQVRLFSSGPGRVVYVYHVTTVAPPAGWERLTDADGNLRDESDTDLDRVGNLPTGTYLIYSRSAGQTSHSVRLLVGTAAAWYWRVRHVYVRTDGTPGRRYSAWARIDGTSGASPPTSLPKWVAVDNLPLFADAKPLVLGTYNPYVRTPRE